ncbi:MAG: recombinase family protein [Acidobacteria bacterium]|nr:MAG: recombinase family protein [Acidobacteriota bacterium]
MKPAVIYARVSSKDQAEGFSIPAQLKFLREYALKNDLEIVSEFVDVETAKTTGRKRFGEMLTFFRRNTGCRTLIVEKTDRLYRNFRDCVTLEDIDVEIHLPKEGQVISKEAKSQAKLVHGIQLVIARNYIENLKEEVKKGMLEKAEQGIYPSRPPLGYRNNKLLHTIEIDEAKAPIARRMFSLYATGQYSLTRLRIQIKREFGVDLAKGYLDRLLKNPFYRGQFCWEGKLYAGTHAPLFPIEVFEQVQSVFKGHNKLHYRKRDFPYRGLLTCAYDGCRVTAELKKERYTYYRCTGFRGRCGLPYFREDEIGERLGQVLKDIHIPDAVLAQLQESLLNDRGQREALAKEQRERYNQRLTQIGRRMDFAYQDRLDGKIAEEFWVKKSAEWQQEEMQIRESLRSLENVQPERYMNASRILELANKSSFLYVRQDHAEKAKLLKMVLSNCGIDAVSLYPTYRKPFDLIFQKAKREEWRARGDSNSRPSGS